MRRLFLFALSVFILGASPALGELTQQGNLFVHFGGGLAPRELPRDRLAPVAVRIEGTITTPAGERPPSLRTLRIALARGGRLASRGLPVCSARQIDTPRTSAALAACGRALVGGGGFTVRSDIQGQHSSVSRGEILLFNAKLHGHTAILARLYQAHPTPGANVIFFHVHRTSGAFATVIVARLPPALVGNSSLRSIYIQLQRRYTYAGRRRSYLSASCSTPPGVNVAAFDFAHASMSFEDGRTLGATLVRSCKVR